MHAAIILPILGAALVRSQGAPPAPVLLTETKSGVLPVLPTPFSGVETLEGAIIDDGPANPGFTGLEGNATVQSNLPAATYEALLPASNFDELTGSNITGSITGVSTAGGSGVTFTVNFTGFPSEAAYGPFVYHIHGLPVPSDGNCSATLGHLDPTDRGEYYPCEATAPQTCQAGDLAGKHGNITGTTFSVSYTDPYLSTIPGSAYYFGDLSVVIHSSNTTRLTCANFTQLAVNSTSGGNATASVSGSATPTQTTVPYTGAASKVSVGVMGGIAGLAVFLL